MAQMEGGYPLPPALKELPRHPILEKAVFEQLHRNEIVETKPHVLHFGGFQIHKEHTHLLRVVNTSPTSLRVKIIGPSTQWFRIDFDKKGLLAPGMSEDVTVFFTPHEWRYYYDTVKIFCGDMAENLVVPIHAYPSANEIKLPRIIDFGRVAIGTKKTRVIPLTCKIPIQFEYEFEMLQSHPDFTITPLQGVIPADGTTEVVVTFSPTRHRTARMELLFNIAQFDFDPVTVSVVGSCAPDLLKDEIVRAAQAELEVEAAEERHEKMTGLVEKLKKKRGRGPVESKHPTFNSELGERTVEGVKVPATRFDAQATTFVMNQTAGKLPLKDLSAFIREQSEGLKTMQSEQAGKAANAGSQTLADVAAGPGEDEGRQALELRFEMQFREVEKYDRSKELKSTTAARGEEQPTPEEVEAVKEARRQRHAQLHGSRLSAEVGRVDAVLHKGKVAVPSSFKPAAVPTWDDTQNDTFSVRLQVIDRFLRATAKLLKRLRAARRSRSLRAALVSAGVTDRLSCKAWVEEETKAAAAGSKGRSGGSKGAAAARGGGARQSATSMSKGTATGGGALAALAKDDAVAEVLAMVSIPKDFVLPPCIPTSQPGMALEAREPVEVVPLNNFEEFLPAAIAPRMDFKVLEYQKFTLPPPAAYMRPHSDVGRLKGALEEHSVRGPRGSAADGAEDPLAMPDSCLFPPSHDAMSLLVPSTECRTYVPLPEATEGDPEFSLSQMPPLIEPLEAELLLPEGIMAIDAPQLDVWRSRRQIPDPFQHMDPAPGCFAEAGGPFGPRRGCDAAGERLSYLPVGACRDVPSDTDDDECGEFVLPPPTDETFDAARQSLDMPLASERWRQEREREEGMKTRCASNNKAVRERLIELNESLSFRNKVYLG